MWFIQCAVRAFSVFWSRLSIARDETDSRHDFYHYVYNLTSSPRVNEAESVGLFKISFKMVEFDE